MTRLLLLSLLLLAGQGQAEQCYEGEEASWQIKSWLLTGLEEEEKTTVKFYETEMWHVRPGGGSSWYVVSDGWQGAYYYSSPAGQQRRGIYLYPDYLTLVVGLWTDHVLVTGQVSTLTSACQEGEAWTLHWAEPHSPYITYSPPSHFSYGVEPTSRDPYETRTVTVDISETEEANQGLFTAREVMAGEVLAFYSGLIINCESSLRALDRRVISDEEEHERNMYNIALDLGGDEDNLCIDLPPEMGTDSTKYSATLAHKANHNFEPNAEFILFSAHPTLGTVMAITALEDLKPGVEVTVNYGYNFTAEPDQPEWFKALWLAYYGDSETKEDSVGMSGHQEL